MLWRGSCTPRYLTHFQVLSTLMPNVVERSLHSKVLTTHLKVLSTQMPNAVERSLHYTRA